MTRRKAGVAFATALALALPVGAAGPASADSSTCVTLPVGPTPEIAIHMTGPDPEVHVPSVSDVTLCVGADVVLPEAPTIEREQCGGFGSCMKFYVDYALTGYADVGASICYTVGTQRTCLVADVPRLIFDEVKPGRLCVGYDMRNLVSDPCENFSW